MPRSHLVPGFGMAFAVAGLLVPAGSASSQTATYSCAASTTQSGTYVCTVSPGNFNAPLQVQIASNLTYSGSSTGNFVISTPSGGGGFAGALEFSLVAINGTSSSTGNGQNGSPAGPVQFNNSGSLSQTLLTDTNTPFTAFVLRSASQGGNGGNYTNTDTNHSAGAAQTGSTVNVTNAGPIQFATSSSVGGVAAGLMFGGAGLLAESLGGQGGNVTSRGPDQNGNPQYGSQTGTNGASAGAVTLTNSGAISVFTPNVMQGYWAMAGRSLGGNAGTGNNGQAGGSATQVEVTTTAPVTVAATWITPSGTPPLGTPTGLFGVLALSQGGNGTMSVNSGNNGGPGGSTGAAFATVTGSQDAPVTISASGFGTAPQGTRSAAVGALALGGNGGAGYDSSTGGSGGNAGAAEASARFANITASGNGVLGLLALSQGGSGGNSGIGQDHSRAGPGGASSVVTTSSAPDIAIARLAETRVTTSGSLAAGVAAIAQGGAGGTGQDYTQALEPGTTAGMGGAGGAGGAVRVEMLGGGVTTTGSGSPAILGLSRGGTGGNGGNLASGEGDSGTGGAGGTASSVFVRILGDVVISTAGGQASDGTAAFGVSAASIGGMGGTGGAINVDLGGAVGDGGAGGSAEAVTIQLGPRVSVATTGSGAIGVIARSVGGGGGSGSEYNSSGGIATNPGNGGAGGNSGTVTVESAATITTTGQGAHGIMALSITGTSGSGGNGAGIIYGPAGSAGASGTVGPVSVTNRGSITTQGQNAIGIQAQSIGGGTGTAGATDGGFFGVGGSAPAAASGNTASVTHSSRISTAGQSSFGILVQSIGGGGGNGGDSNEVIGSFGGSGGGGGSATTVTATLSAGTIATQGNLAHGLVAQSIGGGGGTGGNATSAGTLVTMSYGGSGGDGGGAGAVTVTATGGSIGTLNTNAAGIVAQSIGGGGGAGGSAYSTTGSTELSVAVAMGGSGGSGGTPGGVTLTLSGTAITTGKSVISGTNTNPVDSYGIVAQSLGGGGGLAGSATARAVAVGLPNPETGNSYTGALSFAMGGSGGSGGNGGNVSATLNDNATIATQGQGSHGLLLQSIGGGGGAGGDSSALAATISYSRASSSSEGASMWNLQASVALGGSGGDGGNGGPVNVTLSGATVTTYGDYANAVVAQSIGGGGGNGGVGSSNTLNFGNSREVKLGLNLGGTGGSGGQGGSVTVTHEANSVIQTYGSGAIGIVGQSIGGGGGTAQGGGFSFGGAYSLGQSPSVTPQGYLNVQLGATGATGGSASPVTATISGQVRTAGGDAQGVVLQSIGGGGGTGGAAGADASSDNPINPLTGIRETITEIWIKDITFGLTGSVTVGGSGGAGGSSNLISYSQSGSITTQGDWSHGVLLQGIGGGGGKGGVATSAGSGLGLSTEIAVGGAGGPGGLGGYIGITFASGSSISTGANTANGVTGYGAFGVLAQSVGGGGGVGVDGNMASTGTMRLGATFAGIGGNGGQANSINLGGTTSITTLGDVAVGVVLQSIGGGGGLAGNGSSFTDGLGPVSGSTSITVGAANGAGGNGAEVIIQNAALTISTAGANAYGILAQSVGGGGGFAFSSNITTTTTTAIGAQNVSYGQAVGNGNSMLLSLSGGSIRTSGFGAHGIVAQSIGGGGGIAGVPAPGITPTLVTSGMHGPTSTYAPAGNGGTVTINSSSPITTTGDFAYGILAQSVGSGGGLLVQGSTIVAGTSSAAMTNGGPPNAPGGIVTVTQSAPISATGANSVGIFAQSAGASLALSSVVNVTVSAAIQGGSGSQGRGIWVDSYDYSSLVTVTSTGSVSALSGVAISMTQGGVVNEGTVTGSYNAPSGFTNYGTLNAGDSLVAASLVNAGTLRVAALSPYGVSRVSDAFIQTPAGVMAVQADFAGRRAARLEVAGAATLDGRVRPLLATALPDIALPFLTVGGNAAGMLTGEATPVFGYGITEANRIYSVKVTSADFTPAGFPLSRAQAAVAGHLQSAWDAGGSLALAPFFALFGNTAALGGPGPYATQMQQLSPDTTFAPGARQVAGAQAFANAALSCPAFEGTTAMLVEGQCVWARVMGRTATQGATDGVSRFRVDTSTWQVGGQRELGGGWFLGGSLAYEAGRLSSSDKTESGRGEAGYGAVTVKYQTGPWLFSGVAFGGGGSFDTRRTIQLPGFGAVASGGPGLSNLGVMLRASFTMGGEEIYLRPSVTLGVVHARSGGYRESGAGALSLDVSSASATIASVTPAVEVGGRIALAPERVLRLFANAGLSFASNDSWTQEARLLGAPAGAAAFRTAVRMDGVVGRVTAGAQLYAGRNLSLRLQYEGEYSNSLTGHGGTLALSWAF
ncbi:autotransporter outer membrane beta-barrel domain-containing protein [Sediminicoccus rosea]|uniref:Autotransporter outer membrane beta-barrel domain-containing protein n=1 Tax=Sediminicoccus rosea TaxID=1225128 RepID=A0ABZ0PKL7_9PROT|nr:autotransporter outer membrane beta-barrel domain-containing protein [Sediminicoccus rosea]WPB86017.1 autotransporter outer membrane beta-barrel domain-containing protein [Sediminicoccus rosea]